MKDYLARVMQISYLNREQLERLQKTENRIGYTIPNWNIQEILHLQTIKEKYGIPEDNELIARHNARIDSALQEKGLLKTAENYDTNLEWIHAVDWNIFHRGNEIIWDYSGGRGSRGRGRLMAQISDEERQ